MMELQEFREDFLQNVKADAFATGDGSTAAFVNSMAGYLVDTEFLPDFQPAFYDQTGKSRKRLRVDGYVRDEIDNTMNLIVADFKDEFDEPRTFGKQDLSLCEARVKNFAEAAINGDLVVDISTPASDLKEELKDYRDVIRKYRILVFTDAVRSKSLKELDEIEIDGKKTECQIWDIDRLFQICGSDQGRQSVEISFKDYTENGLPCIEASASTNNEYLSYLCVIPGNVLADIYDKYGSALLEGNVRSFLSTKVAVNKSIRRSILENPDRFFALNNGVSATAHECVIESINGATYITHVEDFQIINGGQTTASLSNTRYKDKADISSIYVQMKLTKIGEMDDEKADALLNDISRASNSQNKVSDADFFARHPFHVEMEKISRRLYAPGVDGKQYNAHWFYERARGQYLQEQMRMTAGQKKKFLMQNPKNMVVSKTDLAKVRNSWHEKPYIVSKGASYSFKEFANEIDTAWNTNNLQFNEKYFTDSIALLILFKEVEKIVSKSPWYQGSYRANIVTYSIALFHRMVQQQFKGKDLDLQIIWNRQTVPEILSSVFIKITEVVYFTLTGDRPIENVTQWSKQANCWETIKKISIVLPANLSTVIIDNEEIKKKKKEAKDDQKIVSGLEAQKEVIKLTGEQWQDISKFAAAHKLIGPADVKILQIAIKIPSKIPNPTECKKLLKILDKVRGEGYKV